MAYLFNSYRLLFLSLFSIGLLFFRIEISGQFTFLFLLWNLFLAWIPLWISRYFIRQKKIQSPIFSLFVMTSWLLFLPNAPYILTDFLHLHQRYGVPMWFDIMLIFSFALTGIFIFIETCNDVFAFIKNKIPSSIFWMLSPLLSFLVAFGIYLGRFLRWNSWDILQDPLGLAFDVLHRFVHPEMHPRTWGITLILGSLLWLLYAIQQQNKEKSVSLYEN